MNNDILIGGDKPKLESSKLHGFKMDGLYRVAVVTDIDAGDLKVLEPILEDLTVDIARATRYFSYCVATHRGQQYPVNFEIVADTLYAALRAFPETAQSEVQKFVENLEAYMRRAALANGGRGPKVLTN